MRKQRQVARQRVVNRLVITLFLVINSLAVSATDFKILTPNPQQGSMIIGKVGQGTRVLFNDKALKINSDGYFVFGVGREAPPKIELTVISQQKSVNYPIHIQAREWQIERIDGLPPSKVSPRSKEVLARISAEAKLVRTARAVDSDFNYFNMDFIMPAEGRISGVFGSQRVLNGEPKRPHYGLDVANKVGTPVIAPVDGIVTLTHQDMFYSGGTLVIDHGHGISSTYIHLNSIDVEEGQRVQQGQVIGTIGATGRATGPHLDWRLNWFNTRLDPYLLIDKNVKR